MMNFKINTTTYLRGRPPAASASCRFHAPFSLFVRRQRVSVRVAVRRPPVRRRTVRHAREGTTACASPSAARPPPRHPPRGPPRAGRDEDKEDE